MIEGRGSGRGKMRGSVEERKKARLEELRTGGEEALSR